MFEDLDDKAEEDLVTIKLLKNYLKGDQKIHRTRGSLLNMIASRNHPEASSGKFLALLK